MGFVENKDLMFGKKGIMASLVARTLMELSGLNRTNRLYEKVENRTGDFTTAILEELNATYEIDSRELSNIPSEGGVIIVSNHPTGGLDGIMLINAVLKVRRDVKVLGNFLLSRIAPMRQYVISVNPFEERSGKDNLAGLKAAMRHLDSGGALIIFPAGEVATWQDGFKGLRDKEWDNAAVKFVKHAGVPVVPVFINARNSRLFHLAGKINPKLRTLLLPHEINNKEGANIEIRVGIPVSRQCQGKLGETDAYGDYLRAMVDYMGDSLQYRRACAPKEKNAIEDEYDDIVARPDKEQLLGEISAIRGKYLLFRHTQYSIYCVPPEEIPTIMVEIGRMREITFRQVGEGTRSSIDTDKYDLYYHQLFIWDDKAESLVGAYRLGFGDYIVDHYGRSGFYTSTLYEYSAHMEPILSKTIELGRSFITQRYQRQAMPLLLLWKGIMHVLLENERFRYLIGTVTISGEFFNTSKGLIIDYLQRHHYNPEIATMVTTLSGIENMDFTLDTSLVKRVDDIELINALVSNIEGGKRSIPVLIKKYLQLNSHVIGFDFDPDFADSIDALMLLDISSIPERTLKALSKEMDDGEVLSRFKSEDASPAT